MLAATDEQDVNFLIAKAREWARKVVEVFNTPAPGALAADKAKLLKWANVIRATLEKIGITFDELKPIQNQLGIIPFVIGGVAIAAAAAAIAKWTYDYKKFMTKVTEQRRLEAGGMDAAQAAAIVQNTYSDPGFLSSMLKPKFLLPLGALAAAWYIFKGR